MTKLNFSLEGNSLGEFTLEKERITIGRRPNNDIHIDNLAVSGEHAVIITIGNDSFLEDLNSTNGTLVNKLPIKKHVLHHDDIIEFGKYQLQYINEKQQKLAVKNDGFAQTVMIEPAKARAVPSETISEVNANETALPEAQLAPIAAVQAAEDAVNNKVAADNAPIIGHLQVLNGTSVGRDLPLNKTITTLGKPGEQVAVITKRPHGYFITHVEGAALPMVNAQTIGVQAFALNDHDVIELGGIKMEFYLS